jgi:hypothetical protein
MPGNGLPSNSESLPGRTFPRVIAYAIQACSIVLQLAGLMALTQSKIHWQSYFLDIVSIYRERIAMPVAASLRWLEIELDINLDWIPDWFPDYLPIAAVFTLGLVSSYSHLTGKSPVKLFMDEMENIIAELKGGFWDTIWTRTIWLGVLIFFSLTSPAFFLVFPVVMASFFVAALLFVFTFYGGILLFLIKNVLPYVFLAALLAAVVWFLAARDSFYHFAGICHQGVIVRSGRLKKRFPDKLQEIRGKIALAASEAKIELKRGVSFYFRLIAIQFSIAAAIFFVFLTIAALNNSLL